MTAVAPRPRRDGWAIFDHACELVVLIVCLGIVVRAGVALAAVLQAQS